MLFFRFLFLTSICLLGGCAEISYYMQSVDGHLNVVHKTKNIQELLQDDATDKQLAQRLQLVTQIRRYAIEQLHLPESDSYTIYADLGRNYVLKNLFAAEEFSVKAKQWCYPVVGCAGYRGYFNELQLEAFKSELVEQGYDVYVANVPAYSTLGWFDDPVLNTFINWPDYLLAGLIFHELSHQYVYVDGDSKFNESFAVAVQQAGVESWLSYLGEEKKLKRFQSYLDHRFQVVRLIINSKEELQKIYATTRFDSEKRLAKQQAIKRLRLTYQELSAEFEVPDGFSSWFKRDINNAQLVSISTYYEYVPVFKKILKHHNNKFKEFLQQVKQLAALPRKQRDECLDQWQQLKNSELASVSKISCNE